MTKSAYTQLIEEAQAKAQRELPPGIAKAVLGQLMLFGAMRPDADHQDDLQQLLLEIASLTGAERMAAEMSAWIGKYADMTIDDNGMTGSVFEVVPQVNVVTDYGYAMNAMATGFSIVEAIEIDEPTQEG